ncbi:DNA mismatch repair endonuclease MutH [Candidatus Palibaumannia cicadellinicola]|uniref:DNA mismatch repair protein MutH n=1 Tax=Candidatus Palibaumannia cicadellinicola TaxID=186490 RepID=A0A088NBE8_9GAMM|nr:DNA mismatch repair endonuclease MutH [Candidatus Baumannia cicadellinicola]AIN47463.1 DNA mismatch repair endonuclease MutH [Candidatus Baumannia cicadellinicola]
MSTLFKLFIPMKPPANERELLRRAKALAGFSLGELAAHATIVIPDSLKRYKGWIGALLEQYLGASAGNKPEQDFAAIGIELKTIPVDRNGRPLETTFVCVAPLTGNSGMTWEVSYVRYKLARVLWIPVEGQREIPLAQRRIGTPLLWSPDSQEVLQLQCDWEALMDLIVLGKIKHITASHGEVLQLRPKAANSRSLTTAIGELGQPIRTIPLGFYLKKNFTGQLLARNFLV